jgi:hypothetical protein
MGCVALTAAVTVTSSAAIAEVVVDVSAPLSATGALELRTALSDSVVVSVTGSLSTMTSLITSLVAVAGLSEIGCAGWQPTVVNANTSKNPTNNSRECTRMVLQFLYTRLRCWLYLSMNLCYKDSSD